MYVLFERDFLLGPPTLSEALTYFHPSSRAQVKAHFKNALEKGQSWEHDVQMLLPGKELTWHHGSGVPCMNAGGKVICIKGTTQDITERKLAEKLLMQREEQFRVFMNANPDLSFIKDSNFRYVFANKQTADFFGKAIDEILGKTDHELAGNEKIAPCFSSDYKVLESNTLMTFEEILGDKVYETTKFPLLLPNHKKGIGGIMHNITERKQIEKHLRQLAQVSAVSSDFIVIIGADFCYRFANKVYLDARQLLPEEIIGHHMIDIVGKERFEQLGRPQVEAALRGKIVESLETTDLGRNELRYLHVHVAPFREADDTISGVVMSGRDITEIHQSEIQQRKLFQAVEQSPASVIITNTTGDIEYVNPKFTEVTGFTFEEAIGQNPRILKSGKQSHAYYKELWTAISSGKAWKGEFHNKKKSGELFWESALVSPITNANGDIINYLAVKEDITERKRTETSQNIQLNIARAIHIANNAVELIETTRQELSQIFDTTNFFVAIYKPETDTLKQLVFKDEMDDFNEWSASESFSGQVVKSGKSIILRGDELQAFSKQFNLKKIGTNPACWLGVPLIINNKAGGVMVIQHYSNPDAYSKNDVDLIEMIAHEIGIYLEKQLMIDDIIKAKGKAEESENRYRALLNASFGGIAIHSNGIILECNHRLCEMTGYAVSELIGRDIVTIIAKKSRKKVEQHIQSGYEQPYEAIGVRENGKEFPLRIEARMVTYKGKQVRTAEFRDITDIKRVEDKLRKLNNELETRVIERTAKLEAINKELESFSYSISHDLRTPLRALNGFAQMLIDDYATSLDEEGLRMLKVIISNANKMGMLIDDLLNFSRLGRGDMKWSVIHMHQLVNLTIQELVLPETRGQITFSVAGIPDAPGDAALIKQVWINLISNAIKYTSKKNNRIINIGYKTEHDQNIYYVSDNGAGFNMEYYGKLFGVFQRLHSNKDFEGTGIGLAIVNRIINRHGGKVWAEGKVGEGATFYFSLHHTAKIME